MKLRGLTCAVLAVTASYASGAFAQEQVWLKDRRYGEGVGIRAGDLELHPGIGAEFGYDSNYFLRSKDETVKPIDTLRLRIGPSFSVSTVDLQRRGPDGGMPEPPKVEFRATAAATYNEFIALKSNESDQVSKQRNIAGGGGLQLTILPRRPFGGDVYADFLRSTQPSNDANFNYNRLTGRFGGGVTWAPGGGMFDWRLGYEYMLTYFQDATFRSLGNNYHQVNTRGRWRFLPRTAVLYDASLAFMAYNQNPTPAALNSDPVRARLGLNGLVTQSFAILAMAGWGSSFYKGTNAQQYDGLIAQAELKWFITPNSSGDLNAPAPLSTAALGYTRDFYNSYLGDYFVRDRIYLTLSHMFSGAFLLVLDGSYVPTRYGTIYDANRANPKAGFTAPQLLTSVFGEYRIADSFGINATFRYSANLTDVDVNGDKLGWNRVEAFLGARWFL